jgi:hypothetical protein
MLKVPPVYITEDILEEIVGHHLSNCDNFPVVSARAFQDHKITLGNLFGKGTYEWPICPTIRVVIGIFV